MTFHAKLLTVAIAGYSMWLCAPGASVYGQSPTSRQLAPGVMKTIPATPLEEETFSGPRPIPALVGKLPDWTPNYSPVTATLKSASQGAIIHRSVWQVEISFKPVRTIEVAVADGRGGSAPELVWYLLYQLRNTGSHLRPVAEKDASGNTVHRVQKVDHAVRCFPSMILKSHDHGEQYADQALPEAVRAIHAKELRDPRIKLHTSVEVNSTPLEVSTADIDRAIWGVATWRDVDPRTDFLSVFVRGLSNAYQWEDLPDAATSRPGEGATLSYKTLQLNFWRPGDTIRESEDTIRFGMPDNLTASDAERVNQLYGVDKPENFRWLFLP